MNKHLNNFQRNLYKQNYSLNTYEEASKINSFENQGEKSSVESKNNIANNLVKKEELNNGENCKGEKLKNLITKPKSALFKNLKSVNLNQISHQYPFQKRLLIDTNIIENDFNNILNGNNIEKSELKKSLLLEALIEKLKYKNDNNGTKEQIEEKKEEKEKINKNEKSEIKDKNNDKDIKNFDKIDNEKNGKCITPQKDEGEKEKEENVNKQHDKEKIIIRIVRREKNSKEKKKKEKHQHQAKKEINEEENMSNFKSQNKDKSSMEGEYEEMVDETKKIPKEEKKEKEENDNIKNNGDKNGVIDEFLNEMEKKDINDKEKNDKLKLDESEDPFTKAENEYRNKNDNENMDKKNDLNANLDIEINKLINEIQNENNNNEDVGRKEEGKYNTYNTVENKDGKRKDFYQIYLDSLNNDNYNSFNPFMIKSRPGDLYLKEVREYQNSKEMMKNYRKKEKYNLFFNRVFSNKYIFKEKPSILLNNSNSREKIGNNTLENFKKLLKINLTRNSHKLKQNNYSFKSASNKYLINSFINTSPINKKKNYFKEKYESNSSKLNIQNIIKYILDKEDEKMTKKLNPINSRRCSEPKNRIVDLLNDPHNPYSTIWPNKFLNVNYNMGIHYTDTEQGVPQLKIKNLKNKNLPPLHLRNKLNNNNKSIFHTFSSGFNLNQKSISNASNYETSEVNDSNNNKINDKISYKGFNLYRNNTEGNYNSIISKETNIFSKKNLSKINEEGK